MPAWIGLALLLPAVLYAQEPWRGRWVPVVHALPAPESLSVRIDTIAPGEWGAAMDFPVAEVYGQGARVSIRGDTMVLEFRRSQIAIRAVPAGHDTMQAILSRLGGKPVDMVLVRVATDPEQRRAQEPVRPLPYATEFVKIPIGANRLAGTLTLPRDDGRHPAVVLIGGSGPTDRDASIAGHRLFLVLADYLTRKGIAVLRFDERGTGLTPGNQLTLTMDTTASDVLAAIRFLRSHPRIAPNRLGLIGHSEGGLIALLVDSASADVGFVVLLATPPMSGVELAPLQHAAIIATMGYTPELRQKLAANAARIAEVIATPGPLDTMALHDLIQQNASVVSADSAYRRQLVESGMMSVTAPSMRRLIQFDPAPYLSGSRTPLLWLSGSLDTQVPVRESYPAAVRLLASRAPAAEARVLPGLNHLFQPARTGGPSEYGRIETTFDPTALDAISAWILSVPHLRRE